MKLNESKISAKIIQQMMHSENIDNDSNTIKSLNIEYNQKLIEHNYGFDSKTLKSKDMINLISIFEYKDTKNSNIPENTNMPIVKFSDIDKNYYKEYNWLAYIPCFQEGVFRVNIGRYVYFKIENIDVDEKSITIFLQDYTYNSGIWGLGTSGNATYKCNENATFDTNINTNMHVSTSDVTLFHDLYTKIPYTELKWSKDKIRLWKDIIITNSDYVIKELKKQNTNNFIELTKYFQHFTIISNQLLSQHKPQAIRETKEQREKRKRTTVNAENTPRKITRNIGPIKMTSTKTPKCPTKDTIIHYKTAVWKCRGGVRKLKSGRLVPFKASVHRRKCLNKDIQAPQTEIKFTK